MPSPTALSMRLLRREGMRVDIVERHLANVRRVDGGLGIKKDLYGFADLIACREGLGILLVQTTSLANLPARVKKSKEAPALGDWLKSGGRFELHGWRRGANGWECKRVTIDDPATLTPVIVEKPKRKRPRSRWQTSEMLFQDEGERLQ